MPNVIASWKKRLAVLGLAVTLTSAPLLTPHTASAAASLQAYTGDAAQAITLGIGSADKARTGYVSAAELSAIFQQAARLAGSDAVFSTLSGGPVQRKDAAVLLSQGLKLQSAPESYGDVPDNASFAVSIGAVSKAKLMLGDGAGRFAPNAKLTYEQAYALAYRLYDYVKPFQLLEATVTDIQKAVDQGKLTYKQLVQMYLDRIDQYDDQGVKINAILTINPNALKIAEELDKERETTGKRGPLHGIPIIVKDNFDTNDMPTTAGCVCLKDSVPDKDADQVAKLKAAGAIILAKANLHEFAFGITTSSSLGGQTLNPYAPDHYPGGSSGGTGAAITANFALAGLGTDTGGSIRIPSTFNSLVGIRPTVGLSSRDGIIPLALTQDVGGPIARTVSDAALLLDATAGYDPDDTATAYSVGHIPKSYTDYLDVNGLKGARIGVATELFGTGANEKTVTDVVYQAVDDLKKLGADAVPITIPNLDQIMKFPSLSGYEFKFQLNDYLKELGPNAPYHSLQEIIDSGEYDKSQEKSMIARNNMESLDTQEYKDIILYRTKVTRESLLKVMADNNLDAIVYPSTTQPAAKIGESQNAGNNNRLSPFSGFPAITVPAGFTPDGLPVGIEFLGRAFDEPTLIKLAYAYEQGTHNRRAPALLP
ncbi:amidase family protein [Paenibacillus sp. JX-17]|uniref:Amidase family protein n=1 Tax=Paenibacillus lacisoli TaxID=3064525 RepID=A0ABT9CFR6_9BACL|nr:amidase family protein [Paenibacillus sp. JX-17]MDO7907479.1 amidase family protein [Paenibacillus sp. JX-17]